MVQTSGSPTPSTTRVIKVHSQKWDPTCARAPRVTVQYWPLTSINHRWRLGRTPKEVFQPAMLTGESSKTDKKTFDLLYSSYLMLALAPTEWHATAGKPSCWTTAEYPTDYIINRQLTSWFLLFLAMTHQRICQPTNQSNLKKTVKHQPAQSWFVITMKYQSCNPPIHQHPTSTPASCRLVPGSRSPSGGLPSGYAHSNLPADREDPSPARRRRSSNLRRSGGLKILSFFVVDTGGMFNRESLTIPLLTSIHSY